MVLESDHSPQNLRPANTEELERGLFDKNATDRIFLQYYLGMFPSVLKTPLYNRTCENIRRLNMPHTTLAPTGKRGN
jgi:hypothetical protein